MEDLLFNMAISILISTLKGLKGANKKATLRKVFLKVNGLIAGVYGTEAEFKQAWGIVADEPTEDKPNA